MVFQDLGDRKRGTFHYRIETNLIPSHTLPPPPPTPLPPSFFSIPFLLFLHRYPWPSGQGVRLESGRSEVRLPIAPGFFPGRVSTSDLNIGTPVAALPGAWRYRVGLGLVGPVSVYCDWVRQKARSATFVSVR